MFQEPELETDGNATRAVKRLYASCMDVGELMTGYVEVWFMSSHSHVISGSIESRRETPLLSLLKELGGWPTLEGGNWDETNFRDDMIMHDFIRQIFDVFKLSCFSQIIYQSIDEVIS